MKLNMGLLAYPAQARALAEIWWKRFVAADLREQLARQLVGLDRLRKFFLKGLNSPEKSTTRKFKMN